MSKSQDIQYRQYEFPYHHIPFLDKRGDGKRIRALKWGFEYLVYMNHIAETIEKFSPSSVLDVGCGDGYLLRLLDCPLRVGVDINDRALSFARAFCPAADFRNMDVSCVEESFDVVCAIEVLEHIPDADVSAFLKSIASRVKTGGRLIISVPTINSLLNQKHFRHYDQGLLVQQVRAAIPNMLMCHTEFFYKRTFLEGMYQILTDNPFLQGEIPLLRRYVWRYVKKHAAAAGSKNGIHLISIFERH